MLIRSGIVAAITFFSSILLTRIARKIAIRYHIGDLPAPRKVHHGFVPYLGGAAILVSVLIGVAASIFLLPEVAGVVPRRYYVLGISAVFIALVGLYDDLKKMKFSTKFFFQIITACMVVWGGMHFEVVYIPGIGAFELGAFSFLFVILWIVFITNALNLLDGLDGLAAGVSSIILLIFAVIALKSGRTLVALVNILLILGNLGFLRYNFHPASIFMGDCGSLFLGFSIAIISLEVGRIGDTNSINALIPLTVMAMPVLDTTISFFRRAGKHILPFKADKEHIHHRLMSIGFSHANAVKVIYFISAMAGLMGLSFVFLGTRGIMTILFVGVILCAMLIRRLGYVEIEKNLIVVGKGENNGNGKINGVLNGNGHGHAEPKFLPFDTSQFFQSFAFFISDIVFILAAFLISYFWWQAPRIPAELRITNSELLLWLSWSAIYWTMLLGLNDLYHIEWDTSRIDEIFTAFKIVFFGTIVVFFLSFEFRIPFLPARRVLILYGLLLFLGISIGRLLLISFLKNREVLDFKKRPTLVVGACKRAVSVVQKIQSVPILKFKLLGYIDDHANGNIGNVMAGLPIIGGYEDIPRIIKEHKIREVIVALDDTDREEIADLIALTNQFNVSIKLLPDFNDLMSGFRTSQVYGVPLMRFFRSNMKTWEWLLKRMIDIIISLIVLTILAPIWLIVAAIIVIDSPGPVFYRQKRVGKNKREYNVMKFRSMITNAEELTGPKWAEIDDPRVTRVGRFLRKIGLDEIPQFFNVFMGHMSIVGPRPERQFFVNELENSIKFYSRRLIVKPGITGWAQLKYKYDETIEDVREKLKYDLFYIENMSVMLDLKIMVQTLLVGLRKKHQAAQSILN